MVSRPFAILASVVLTLSLLPSAIALDPGPSALEGGAEAWWDTWLSDMDRDGVHDWLEDLAVEALREDPDARLDVVVDLDRTPTSLDVQRLEAMGLEVQFVSRYVDAVAGSLPASAIGTVRDLPHVVMIEAQGKGYPMMESAGPSISIGLARENLGFYGEGVTVAVLDTGINGDHVYLDDLDDDPGTDDPKMLAFYDAYTNKTTTAYDSGEHGTWVAGIAVGTGGGTNPNVGIAPAANLVGLRIGSSGGFPESTALRGLEWTIDNKDTYNISVAVCSWGIVLGGPNDHNGNSAISRLADEVVAAGISVVVAAGNSALSATVTAPGDARNVVTVGSVSDNHIISTFSSEGPTTDGRTKPDVCAPGEDITGPWSRNNGGTYEGDGTSASAPIVGGLIAVMMEANPHLTPAQVKQILHETSEHNTARTPKYILTPNNGYGWGVVHAPGAISRAKDLRPPELDISVSIDSGEEMDLEVVGTYTRTAYTELGENGESRLGEDTIEIEASVPSDWDRPSRVTYTMEGDIVATPAWEPVSEVDGAWRMHATFRVINDVPSLTVAHPTISFTTAAPLTSDPETYAFTTRETINGMMGEEGRTRVSVGGNVQPEITITSPNGGADTADTFFVIRWTDDDPDDNARISLYNDLDSDPDNGKVLISSSVREDPEGDGDSYLWDTSTLVEGRAFYIHAEIDDGTNEPMVATSSGTVTIIHTGGNAPPSVEVLEPDGEGDDADQSFSIEYRAYDPDDIASVSLYWDTDAAGFDGNPIVRDLDEDDGFGSYTWDTSDLEEGLVAYVYAVVSDGQNPQARAYGPGPVTIGHSTGPRMVAYGPTGADVPVDRPVRVTFDSEMDRPSVEGAMSVVPSVAGTYSWTGTTVEYSPGGGWESDTTYTVTVAGTANDVLGNPMGIDQVWSFRTEEAPIPTDPPVALITTPTEGATVSGFVWIEGTGTYVGADGKVEVRIDGGDWREADGTTAWRISWDTEFETAGEHTISARGTDAFGFAGGVRTVNVTVDNSPNSPPQVEPVEDMTVHVGDDVSFTVEATDPDGDTLVFSDDTLLFNIDPSTGKVSFVPSEVDISTWSVEVTVWDGKHQTKTQFIITVEPKEEDESILDLIPLTTMQLVGLLVVLMLIMAVAWAAARSRRGSDAEDEADAEGPYGHRGETA
jgi:serine protease AprX